MERRIFIQTIGLGAVGLYANGLLAFSKQTQPLGVQLYSIRDAIDKNPEAALEKLAGLGYKNLEIYGYDGKFFGKTLREFQTILDNTGLKVISSHHITGIGFEGKRTMSKDWAYAVEDMHDIGAKYMVCAFLFQNERTPEIYQSLPKLFEKSAETALQANIRFAYHNHDFEFEPFGNSTYYDFLLQNTSPDLVQMELDLYWISKAGLDPLSYFDKYPGRFALWHVKDMEAGTKDFCEVGSGTIDFDRLFAAKEKAGLQHWFIEQDKSKGDIFDSLKMSRDYVKAKKY